MNRLTASGCAVSEIVDIRASLLNSKWFEIFHVFAEAQGKAGTRIKRV